MIPLYILAHIACAWVAVAACRADFDGSRIGPAPRLFLALLAAMGPVGLLAAFASTWIGNPLPFYHGFRFLR